VAADPGQHYGRTDAEWEELTTEGLRFLIEQAQMGRTTTYTELNAVIRQRTNVRPFDFDHESERAAMGHLLWRIVERDRPVSGHMISSLVIYLNENDAGTGFYKLAQEYGILAKDASADAKLAFWSGEVASLHELHRRRRR
jgi:hypothetical protein